jgi:hypothetical protein
MDVVFDVEERDVSEHHSILYILEIFENKMVEILEDILEVD